MMGSSMFLCLLLLLALSHSIVSSSIVQTLPGYPGNLPFKLETGYVGVGEEENTQLFYYFVESESSPKDDPLIIWLAGGPGCSTLRAFFYEIGPLGFQYGNSSGKVPALELNPYSWTKLANVIYVDAPVGTGFSYAKSPKASYTSDTSWTADISEFLRKWIKDHPKFINNQLYVTGVSYAGIVIPMITDEIYKGNEAGLQPILNIKGYMIGNPLTDKKGDINSRLDYAHRMALLSDELYEYTKEDCRGEYADVDSNNVLCLQDLDAVDGCVKKINIQHILEPDCDSVTNLVKEGSRRSLRENSINLLRSPGLLKEPWCRGNNYLYSSVWANDKVVQKALNIRERTINEWLLCNPSMSYSYGETVSSSYAFNVPSSVNYHRNLTHRNCRALIFSGDHDMMVPHVGTERWIHSLNLTVTNSWEPWFVDGQEAGFITSYSHNDYSLTFATVKGAGHTAPEFKPEECLQMAKRWFAYQPI